MLESQLFGYRKGAFTGADDAFAGVIRAAAGGTLFLDEIAEIGLDLQPKLLRFLETHEIHPLGEPQPIKVDVRVIAATNADLEQLVADGPLPRGPLLPPQRRPAPAAAAARAARGDPAAGRPLPAASSPTNRRKDASRSDDETLEYLVLYAWPGNVRQLVNEVSRIVAFAEPDTTLTPALLSPEIQASRRTIPAAPAAPATTRRSASASISRSGGRRALERTMVRRALDRRTDASRTPRGCSGISRKGLFLKRRRWGLHQVSLISLRRAPASPGGCGGSRAPSPTPRSDTG